MSNTLHSKPCNGFSLVDIMVGMVVGLLAMLAIMQSFSAFEGQKRTTTTGMEAQENGLMALQALETDIRQAGYGMTTNGALACTTTNTYNSTATPATQLGTTFIPIQITDGLAGSSDTITATYSTSATGGMPAHIVVAMPSPSAILTVNTGNGFNVGDMLLLSSPGSGLPCSRLVATQIQPQANGVNLVHNSGQSNYNPPGGSNIFPPGGYGTNSVVFNMGNMVQNQYQVLCSSLTTTNLAVSAAGTCTSSPTTFANATPLSSNIVSIQAQYGITSTIPGNQQVSCWTDATGSACNGTNWAAPPAADVARIKAIRVAVVARSSLSERPPTAGGVCAATPSTAAPNYPQWNGGVGGAVATIDVTAIPNWQCYRYKVYQTIIPLRNILWANL
ncbi:MAG: hypothetical protein HKM00_00270 [Gallionella sp.]|nr:hypothetical protein [Gallionella sp.]